MVDTGDEAGSRVGGSAGWSISGDEEVGSGPFEEVEEDCSPVFGTLWSILDDSDGKATFLLASSPSTADCSSCRTVFVVLLVCICKGVSDCGCGLSPRVTDGAGGLVTGFLRAVVAIGSLVIALCEGRSWLFDGLGRRTRGAAVALVAVAEVLLLGALRDVVALVKRCVGLEAEAREAGVVGKVLDADAGLSVEGPGVERVAVLVAVVDRDTGVVVAGDDDDGVPLVLLPLLAPILAALRFSTAALRLMGPAGRSPSLRAACKVLVRFAAGVGAVLVDACFFSFSLLTSSSGRRSSLQATSISSAISFNAHFSRLLNAAAALTLTHRLDKNLISSLRVSSTLSLMVPRARPSSPRKRMLPTSDW